MKAYPSDPLPASGVRHGVLALTTAMAVLLYLDRVCISAAAPRISETFSLDKDQMGRVLSAFFLAYALGQVPAGWLGDRLGARAMLTAAVLGWSLCTALTGLATGLATLIASRLLLGFAQAGAYPITARVYSQWIPFPRRGFASSVVTLGGRGGGALAPALTASLIVAFADDWRPVFWIYAALGFVWAAVFWSWFRNTPLEHPACNDGERALIDRSRPPGASSPHGPVGAVPWGAMLRSPSLWMQCASQWATNVSWAFLVTWLPTYYMDTYDVDLKQAGFLSSLPLVAGMAGCLLGGLATDRLTRRLGLKWGRNLTGMGSKLLAGLGLFASLWAADPLVAALAFALVSFATDLGLGATWAYFQDAGGAYVGTFLGWANMFGNLGAAVSPLLLGGLAEGFGWPTALGVAAGLFVVSGLCWLGIDARVPILDRSSPAAP